MSKSKICPFLFAALLSFICPRAEAVDLGLVSVNDTISFPLICLDTLGRSVSADSVHVITWYHGQGANSFTYSTRSTSPKSAAYIDTVSFAGAEYYYFIDPVDTIDSSAPNGPYTGQVVMWAQGEPTVNPFSFAKVDYEARDIYARIDVSISSRSDFDPLLDRVDLADSSITAAQIDSLLMSLGFDTTAVQSKLGSFGATESAITPLSLRQWLANSLGIDGTNDLHTKIDNLSLSGGGTEPETLVVLSSVDSTHIQGARTIVRTLDQSTVRVDGLTTDTDGRLIIELDSDSFFVAVTANNYIQSLDTLIVEQGGGTDTLWLTDFDPGNPSSPDLCRVFGWVYDLSGLPLSGVTVTAAIPAEYQPVKYSGVIITPFKKSTATDEYGYWQLDLLPNTILSDPLSRYSFTIEYPSGVVYKIRIEVPNQSSWQLE